MKKAIAYIPKLDKENVKAAGFDCMECRYEDILRGIDTDGTIGISVNLDSLDTDVLAAAVEKAAQLKAQYVVIDTVNVKTRDSLNTMIEELADFIRDSGVFVLIENGMTGNDTIGYAYGAFSEWSDIKKIVEYGNTLAGAECFGAALNVGYANLLEKNVPNMIWRLEGLVKLFHVNDNDGKQNQRQMPFTFTTGRGAASTEWNKTIGALIATGFDGYVVFDTAGLYERIPVELELPMLRLQNKIAAMWDKQFNYEQVLNVPGKKIILFGAGAMAMNYIVVWGDKYPPAFVVDNNEKLWGEKVFGVEVKKPESILEVPKEERLVLLCNKYYNETGTQLSGMGVEYDYYNDEYYMVRK